MSKPTKKQAVKIREAADEAVKKSILEGLTASMLNVALNMIGYMTLADHELADKARRFAKK